MKKKSGFTLVELMVTSVIGFIILSIAVGAIVVILLCVKGANSVKDSGGLKPALEKVWEAPEPTPSGYIPTNAV